jgi:NarL family two-component system response regulator LiaR
MSVSAPLEQGSNWIVSRIIRVLLADEHEVVALGLEIAFALLDDMQLIGRASNGAEAIEMVGILQPDVVLMDLMMPVMDGFEATVIICKRYPKVKVIALSASLIFEDRTAALQAGAHTYLNKNEHTSAAIAQAIRSVMQ